jgi:hypothetical protein
MNTISKRLPSPAAILACVALLVSLGGVSYAAGVLPNNSVGEAQLRKGAVTAAKVRTNAINSAKVKDGTLNGADALDNSLSGADINESTLGQVPSAATADSANSANSASTANSANTAGFASDAGAVNGTKLRRLAVDVQPNGSATVLTQNGLTLALACTGGGKGTLTATTSVDDSDLYYWGYDTDKGDAGSLGGIAGSDLEDGRFDVGDSVDITAAVGDGDADTALGQIEYYHVPGVSAGVTVHYVINSFAGADDHCQLSGFAIS